jgi:ribonucleoside-diphosphate reductase alpha subunit
MTALAKDPSPELNVSPALMAKEIITQLMDGMETSQLDVLGAEAAYALYTTHPDYGVLATRILVSAMHKDHSASFAQVVEQYKTPVTFAQVVEKIEEAGLSDGCGVFNNTFLENVRQYGEEYEKIIDHNADYEFTYFALRTLQRAYLIKRGKYGELPQHLWMRVAVGFHGSNIERVRETYELLRDFKNIYGTPTLFNMGLVTQQLSSCYLTGIHHDSIKGIYDALTRCAFISKTAGGIGMHIHNIRNIDAPIKGTGGTSSGIVPMLRQFNETARYVDQGGGKRPGSIAIYAEPHLREILSLLDLRKNHGDENRRARDLFYALWVSDLFMERVESDGKWSLFCPSNAPGLSDVWGNEYKELYERYEREGRAAEVIDARKLWFAIIESQIETGTPYMLYKDACNGKSNHQHLGTIKSSNLCTEIVEYTAKDETAVCNLSSICLPRFVVKDANEDMSFNFEELHRVTKVVTRNLSRVIDINSYPVISAGRSNKRHRPIGLGVQGLDDVFKMFRYPFDSEEANNLNAGIFETIYHAAVETSVDLARERQEGMKYLREKMEAGVWNFAGVARRPDNDSPEEEWEQDPNYVYEYSGPWGVEDVERENIRKVLSELRPIPEEMELPEKWAGSYSSFNGSPMSQGRLQPDMWEAEGKIVKYSGMWDWDRLRNDCVKHGCRLSLMVAPMPTASTSQIEGNNEAFEPRTSNLYMRRTGAGEFTVMNEYLVRDLIERGHWNEDLKNSLIANNGSVQHLPSEILDNDGKKVHQTAWELSMKSVIDQARARAPFIDQSMSMNLWMERPTFPKMSAMHFYAWKQGLKTGMYYLRTRAIAAPQQVTVPVNENGEEGKQEVKMDAAMCSLINREACEMCSA